eukprot:s1716_g7.t1
MLASYQILLSICYLKCLRWAWAKLCILASLRQAHKQNFLPRPSRVSVARAATRSKHGQTRGCATACRKPVANSHKHTYSPGSHKALSSDL